MEPATHFFVLVIIFSLAAVCIYSLSYICTFQQGEQLFRPTFHPARPLTGQRDIFWKADDLSTPCGADIRAAAVNTRLYCCCHVDYYMILPLHISEEGGDNYNGGSKKKKSRQNNVVIYPASSSCGLKSRTATGCFFLLRCNMTKYFFRHFVVSSSSSFSAAT